ncbi:retrovirus-related pol polyprotein from transposon TNT 1-94 [Tanacetum coccineum]
MEAGQRKPKVQWTTDERKTANLDQRLKSLIMYVLPDDQINFVINCLTAKSTWDDLILYHEGPSDVKESRVMDLKLCYNTFKFKKGETLTQTFTRYKALMNEQVNDDINLSKLEINIGFINGLPKKWLSFCQSLRNTNHVKDSELASLFGKLKYKENLIDGIYETQKEKSLVSAMPLLTAFFSTFIVQDFQDSPDDEEDTKSSNEYLNDLEEEYQARALLAKSKRFYKKGTQRFSSAKATDKTECHKCGRTGHFTRDCFAKTPVPSYQSPFHSKQVSSSMLKPKLRPTKDFEAKYNKVKTKLAFHNSSTSPSKLTMLKNKVLMALAEDNNVVSKEGARNGEWVKISMRKCISEQIPTQKRRIIGVDQLIEDPSSSGQKDLVFVKSSADDTKVSIPCVERPWLSEAEVCSTPLPPLKKLDGAEPVSGPKTIKSSLRSKSTFKAKTLKGKPYLAPTKGNKSSSASKVNSAPADVKLVVAQLIPQLIIMILNDSKECNIKKPISYLDSECSRHMTGVRNYLHKYVEQRGPKVLFGDDLTCVTKGYSSIKCNGIFDEKRRTIFNSNKEFVMIDPRVRDVYVLDMTSSEQESYSKEKPCSSCEKGKHHRASFKTKQIFSIKICLYLLHMDLFRLVTPMSINHEKYTLVIVDKYSRNSILVDFCDEKGISKKISSPYTPEQNGVAERKNKTLIEVARTMLLGSVFSKQYWNEAVATCLLHSKQIHYFYIYKHKYYLAKFDEKADDGYFLGYSLVSKAFRVFSIRKQQTEETYNITFDESIGAIKFSNSSVDNINVAESERYPPDEYLHHYEPSQKYQVNINEVSFIDPYERSDQSNQSDQNDHPAQENDIPNDNPPKYSNHNNDSPIIENLINVEVVQDSGPTSSPDKHIELVNIIGNPGAGMLTRAMAKILSAALAHECLFIDFISKEEPKKVFEVLKHPGWVDAMQDELNQFTRNKDWTLVPVLYGKTIIESKWVFRNKRDETRIVIKNKARLVAQGYG